MNPAQLSPDAQRLWDQLIKSDQSTEDSIINELRKPEQHEVFREIFSNLEPTWLEQHPTLAGRIFSLLDIQDFSNVKIDPMDIIDDDFSYNFLRNCRVCSSAFAAIQSKKDEPSQDLIILHQGKEYPVDKRIAATFSPVLRRQQSIASMKKDPFKIEDKYSPAAMEFVLANMGGVGGARPSDTEIWDRLGANPELYNEVMHLASYLKTDLAAQLQIELGKNIGEHNYEDVKKLGEELQLPYLLKRADEFANRGTLSPYALDHNISYPHRYDQLLSSLPQDVKGVHFLADNVPVTDEILQTLSEKFPIIKNLSIDYGDNNIGVAGLKALQSFKKLESLYLINHKQPNDFNPIFAFLPKFPLETLSIDFAENPINDIQMKALTSMESLKKLNLFSKVENVSLLKPLLEMPNLKEVSLAPQRDNPAWVQLVDSLKQKGVTVSITDWDPAYKMTFMSFH